MTLAQCGNLDVCMGSHSRRLTLQTHLMGAELPPVVFTISSGVKSHMDAVREDLEVGSAGWMIPLSGRDAEWWSVSNALIWRPEGGWRDRGGRMGTGAAELDPSGSGMYAMHRRLDARHRKLRLGTHFRLVGFGRMDISSMWRHLRGGAGWILSFQASQR